MLTMFMFILVTSVLVLFIRYWLEIAPWQERYLCYFIINNREKLNFGIHILFGINRDRKFTIKVSNNHRDRKLTEK